MSTSAIIPASSQSYSVDFTSPTATSGQLSVFNSILGQLQTAISGGDLTTAQTLYNALSALSPSSVTDSNVQGTFLTSVGQALSDGSVTEAQSALAAFQSATPTTTTAAPTPNTAATASTIASNLVQSQIQFNLVTSLLGPASALGTTASTTLSSTDQNTLTSILNAAYSSTGSTATSATSTSATTATTPYDTLVASIQASLTAGNGTITPALAYLQASGNFVNTTA